ncbi:unnamed protein product [Scytosiphon promiscuus]
MMSLVQQAIVARCLLVVAQGGVGVSGDGGEDGSGGGGGGPVVFEGGLCSRAQCRKLVCEFLQTLVSECPPLLHLLLRQTLPDEAVALLLDGVPVCRGATVHLFDVMAQQSWEARAFGVRASALLAERFPTEKAFLLCKVALHVLCSMCDSEARPPRGLDALAAVGGGVHAGGTAGGIGNGSPPSTALLACGMPPTALVRRTFPFAINICQAFPSLKGEVVGLIQSILQKQDLAKMHGAKGAVALSKRLIKILTAIKSVDGGSGGGGGGSRGGDHDGGGRGLNGGGVSGGVGVGGVGVGDGEWPLSGASVAKRPRLA